MRKWKEAPQPKKRGRPPKLPENPAPKEVTFESRRGPVQFTALKRFAPELVEEPPTQQPAAPVNERRAYLENLFYT